MTLDPYLGSAQCLPPSRSLGRRAIRWLLLALACLALGASAAPARAAAQVDVAAQVEFAARKAHAAGRQARATRDRERRLVRPRDERVLASKDRGWRTPPGRRKAPPGTRLYLAHRALLR